MVWKQPHAMGQAAILAGKEAPMTVNNAEDPDEGPTRGRPSLEELAEQQGIRPVESVDDLVRDGVFDSDEELNAFLAHIAESRHADLA